MSSLPIFVGLDYHQDSVQACVLDADGNQLSNCSLPNDADAIFKHCESIGTIQSVAIEACCGAANLADELTDKGWTMNLAHPGFVSRMKQSPDKTDYTDAKILADLIRIGYLPSVWLAPQSLRELRRMVRYRQQICDEQKRIKLRIRALLRENRIKPPKDANGKTINAWTIAWLDWIGSTEAGLSEQDRWIMQRHLANYSRIRLELKEAEKQLQEIADKDKVIQKLLTYESVGLITATTIRAEIGNFGRFKTGKQLSKYCGLSPRNASSGKRQADAGLIKTGNPQLRSVLIEMAYRLVYRKNKDWVELANRLFAKGKKSNVVVAAVANRWVRCLHYEMLQPDSPTENASAV